LDTYQKIYGQDKDLPDMGNDDDINDREGAYMSPTKRNDGSSFLAGAGAS